MQDGYGRRPASRIQRRDPTPALAAALGGSGIAHCIQYDAGGPTIHPLGKPRLPAPPTELELGSGGGRRHFEASPKKASRGEGSKDEPKHRSRPVSRAMVTRVGESMDHHYDEAQRFAPAPQREIRQQIAAGAMSDRSGKMHEEKIASAAATAALARPAPPFALDFARDAGTAGGVAAQRRMREAHGGHREQQEAMRPPMHEQAPGEQRQQQRQPQQPSSHPISGGRDARRSAHSAARSQVEAGVSSREQGERLRGRPMPLKDLKLG